MEVSRMSNTRPSRLRRIVGIAVVATASLAVGIVVTMTVMVRSEPAHWKAHQQYLQSHSAEQIAQDAAAVEQRILSLTQLADETVAQQPGASGGLMPVNGDAISDEPIVRKVRFDQQELNAWVAQKFHEWMAYRDYVMPQEVNDPMIAIENGRLMLSFALRAGEFSQVFTAGFDVTFEPDGMALMELRDVMAGNLSIASDGIGDYLRRYGPEDARVDQIAEWLDKLDRLEFKPSMKIGDTHKARVIAFSVVEDGVEVTLELTPRPSHVARREMIASVPTDNP
jgi:hypothetical protein